MIIVVKYFASISDVIGKTSEEMEWQDGITAGDIWSDVSKILNTLEK
jgi:molybdopterin converting factor small subunit